MVNSKTGSFLPNSFSLLLHMIIIECHTFSLNINNKFWKECFLRDQDRFSHVKYLNYHHQKTNINVPLNVILV